MRAASTVLLARHGRTAWNFTGRWHGQADVPLDDVGRQQAREFARHAPALGIDRIVSSPLVRAADTASAVSSALGLSAALDEGLLEVDIGEWQGWFEDDVHRAHPEFHRTPPSQRRFGTVGESPAECGARFATAVRRLVADHPGDRLLLVTHAYVIRAGVTTLLGLPIDAVDRLSDLANCRLAELSVGDGVRETQLLSWNLGSPHL